MFYPSLLLDHIEGLTRQFPYRIYCTPVTARLLRQKFSFAYELLVSWIMLNEFAGSTNLLVFASVFMSLHA